MPVTNFTHVQYLKNSKTLLDDTTFTEEYQDIEAEEDRLVWLGEFDPGFNATLNILDAAIKTSVQMNSVSGNLTSGILPAGTAVDNVDGYNAWANPTNVYATDGSYADAHLDAAQRQTNFIKCTNFGFTLPGDATPTDIFVTAQGYFADGGNASFSGKIVKAGVLGGDQVGSGVLTSITPTTNQERLITSAVDDGGGSAIWSNPSNVIGNPDVSYTIIDQAATAPAPSNYLECTPPVFSVPAGNIVTNIKVEVYCFQTSTPDGAALELALIFGGTVESTNFGTLNIPWGVNNLGWYEANYDTLRLLGPSDVNVNFGVAVRGVADQSSTINVDAVRITVTYAPYTSNPSVAIPIGGGLWGNSLVASDINASNFGVALQVQNTGGDNQMFIDKVSMEVKYHQAAGNEFTTLVKINPQDLGWETVAEFTDDYVVGAGAPAAKTHQVRLLDIVAGLTNAKAPFRIGLFLSITGQMQYKDASMNGSYMLIQATSEE